MTAWCGGFGAFEPIEAACAEENDARSELRDAPVALGRAVFEARIDFDSVHLGKPEQILRRPKFVGGYTILTKTPADVRQRPGLWNWQTTLGCTVDIVEDPLGMEGNIALSTAPANVRGKAGALDRMTRPENRGRAAADRQDPPRLGNIVVMTARLLVTDNEPEFFRFMDLELESDETVRARR